MSRNFPHDVEVTIGDGVATIRRKGRRDPIVANILGCDRNDEGVAIRHYLDRLVHRQGEDWDGEWSVSGAVSSILSLRR